MQPDQQPITRPVDLHFGLPRRSPGAGLGSSRRAQEEPTQAVFIYLAPGQPLAGLHAACLISGYGQPGDRWRCECGRTWEAIERTAGVAWVDVTQAGSVEQLASSSRRAQELPQDLLDEIAERERSDKADAAYKLAHRAFQLGREAAGATPYAGDRDPELADALGAASSLPRSELLPEVRRLVAERIKREIFNSRPAS